MENLFNGLNKRLVVLGILANIDYHKREVKYSFILSILLFTGIIFMYLILVSIKQYWLKFIWIILFLCVISAIILYIIYFIYNLMKLIKYKKELRGLKND